MSNKVIILDFGSSTSQNLAKKVRELGVYSELHHCLKTVEEIKALNPSALIITGGVESFKDGDIPPLNPEFLKLGIPVLGVALGQNVIANALASSSDKANLFEVLSCSKKIEEKVSVKKDSLLFKGVEKEFHAVVSLAEKLKKVPSGFDLLASGSEVSVLALESAGQNIYTVQFNPEQLIPELCDKIVSNFLFEIAGLQSTWSIPLFTQKAIEDCRKQVGDGKVVLGLSGGIDSTVVAALLHKAIGERLHCIFVDHGLLRKFEAEEVVASIRRFLPGVNLKLVNAQDRFLDQLEGVAEPEEKRRIIGRIFIEVFEEEAQAVKGVGFLAQGTIYPDVIESFSAKGKVIKTHHNVGGLPEYMKLELVEPLRELFKDEVRKVGEVLGLPEELVWRHPFPGPGIGVRQLGALTRERLDILRDADRILYEEMWNFGWYRKVWQSFAILLNQQSTGVRNDARTYENVIAIRCVDSVDAMSATFSPLPYDLLGKVSQRIINEVKGVNRVVFDISVKPPSTIEWE
ncbi:glutamine-hydrolyzing GMP synthase [Desulfovibrio litoralis]|uniref:GMP synthase [glutamine-hydrolyzing] n=1 Tax=Desulfovibrio litoralis DSM 11393 TaxID=1121455 RepID=A0A1M7STG3_9BACT|nr:glutamine-hydrolyzing GMP synthase [Desulfovibrio litoralis]SHN61670.1 GMP synthase (glutamine-hydrolysing) [Desulfovibrio litoralis DSM 11393]